MAPQGSLPPHPKAGERFKETSPLLAKKVKDLDQHTSFVTFLHLLSTTIACHKISIVTSIASCAICVAEGFTEHSIFDPLIFKSIFVVFGFAIGFRNVRANFRRFDALATIQTMLNYLWDIMVMIPDDSRERIGEQLIDACQAVADHVCLVAASRETHLFAVAGLQARHDEEDGEARGLHLGPKSFIAATMLAVEDEIDRINKPVWEDTQKYRRSFWLKKEKFNDQLENLFQLAIPSVSDSYVVLINTCLFLFAAVLPWGLKCRDLVLYAPGFMMTGKVVMTAGTSLFLNTMVILAILFGLNTLASENEDPFKDARERIDIKGIVSVWAVAMREYDTRRRTAGGDQEDQVKLHKALLEHGPNNPPMVRAQPGDLLQSLAAGAAQESAEG